MPIKPPTSLVFPGLIGAATATVTAPIKALVAEKFFDLVGLLGAADVGLATGDSEVAKLLTGHGASPQALREAFDLAAAKFTSRLRDSLRTEINVKF